MGKYWIIGLALISALPVFAQKADKDSLFVVMKDGRAMIRHEVKKDEDIYKIAKQYSVPAFVLSQTNDLSYYDNLEPKRKLFVPLGKYNYLETKPANLSIAKPLYYKAQARDSYGSLSKGLDITADELREWNNNAELNNLNNSIVLIGWVSCPAPTNDVANISSVASIGSSEMAPVSAVVAKKDTVRGPLSELEVVYNYQTSNGTMLDSLSGMVVFFKPQTTVNNKLLYAFSNDLAKGRVIKVINPTTEKFVFAKVIGPLPATKQYLNAKIGLDGRARAELETREIKLWCNLFFKY